MKIGKPSATIDPSIPYDHHDRAPLCGTLAAETLPVSGLPVYLPKKYTNNDELENHNVQN